MYGVYNTCSKLHVVQWANESALLVFHAFRSHDMVARCPRREFFQLRCQDDRECEQCLGVAMCFAEATTAYLPALVAIQLLHLLPHKSDRQGDLARAFGKILPIDVDFDSFTVHTGMTINYTFYNLYIYLLILYYVLHSLYKLWTG